MPAETNRSVDLNGYLLIKDCPLSTEGIYEYAAGQIGLEGDPKRIVQVYRPMEAVSDPLAIESFKSIPFIDEHEMLAGLGGKHPEFRAPEEKGIDGVLTDNVYFDESTGWLRGDIKVFSRKSLESINKHKEDLSLGFGCAFLPRKGVWNGKPYEVIQFNMRGNHLALVDEARIDGARILDAMCFDSLTFDSVTKTTEEFNMNPELLAKLKAILPVLQEVASSCQPAAPATAPATDADDKGDKPDEAPEHTASAPAAPAAPAEAPKPAPEAAEPAAPAAPAVDGDPELPADPADPVDPADPADPADPVDPAGDETSAIVAQIEELLAAVKQSMGDGVQAAPAVGDEADGKTGPKEQIAQIGHIQDEGDLMPTQDSKGVQAFYKDKAIKDRLYDRASKIIGAFECSVMDSKDVAVYAAGKLGLKPAKGQEVSAVELYLNGVEAGSKTANSNAIKAANVMDSKATAPELDAYLNEVK